MIPDILQHSGKKICSWLSIVNLIQLTKYKISHVERIGCVSGPIRSSHSIYECPEILTHVKILLCYFYKWVDLIRLNKLKVSV